MYKAMIKKSKNKKGFTLVELIVVMAILAILAAILIPSVGGMIKRSNEAVDDSTGRNLYMAVSVAIADGKTNDADVAKVVQEFIGGDVPEAKTGGKFSAKVKTSDDGVYVPDITLTPNGSTTAISYDPDTNSFFKTAAAPTVTPAPSAG